MKKQSPETAKQLETLHRYLEAGRQLHADRRFLLTMALGIAILQLTRIPEAGYRPLIVILPGFSFRYSLFGDLFLFLALRRLPGSFTGEGLRLFCTAGALLYLAHGVASFGDRFGTLGTPALLEAAAFWYPSLLGLFFLSRLRPGPGHLLEAGSLLTTLTGSLLLLLLNLSGLFYGLSGIPGLRILHARAIIGAGISLGAVSFAGGLLQTLLFLYFRLRLHTLAPEYKQLEARVYLDKNAGI